MDVVVDAVALVVWITDPANTVRGSGWYVMDAEAMEPGGMDGPHATKLAAEAYARGCGYTEVR